MWAGIAVFHNVWAAGALLVLLGVSGSISTVAVVSTRAELTPNELLGRASSVFRLVGIGIAAGAALAGGVLADRYGLTAPLVTAAGILATLSVVLFTRRR